MNPREQLLEQLRAADDHRVVVDAATVLRILPARQGDERPDGTRLVGEEDVVAGRDQPENGDGDQQQKQTGARQPAG